jgi:hypothetical protein
VSRAARSAWWRFRFRWSIPRPRSDQDPFPGSDQPHRGHRVDRQHDQVRVRVGGHANEGDPSAIGRPLGYHLAPGQFGKLDIMPVASSIRWRSSAPHEPSGVHHTIHRGSPIHVPRSFRKPGDLLRLAGRNRDDPEPRSAIIAARDPSGAKGQAVWPRAGWREPGAGKWRGRERRHFAREGDGRHEGHFPRRVAGNGETPETAPAHEQQGVRARPSAAGAESARLRRLAVSEHPLAARGSRPALCLPNRFVMKARAWPSGDGDGARTSRVESPTSARVSLATSTDHSAPPVTVAG